LQVLLATDATLRMPTITGWRVLQHLGGKVAGVCAGRLMVAILRADRNLRAPRLFGERPDQGCRRTDQQIALGRDRLRARDDRGKLGDRGP
jgi:hypothetical protein